MKYKIEFELPDNDTVQREVKRTWVHWQIWGYSGVCYAEPAERTAKVEHVDLKNTQHWVFKCLECGQYFHKTSWGSPVKYCSRCGARLEWE